MKPVIITLNYMADSQYLKVDSFFINKTIVKKKKSIKPSIYKNQQYTKRINIY